MGVVVVMGAGLRVRAKGLASAPDPTVTRTACRTATALLFQNLINNAVLDIDTL